MTEKARRIRMGLERSDEQCKEDTEDHADNADNADNSDNAKRKIDFSNCESNEGN